MIHTKFRIHKHFFYLLIQINCHVAHVSEWRISRQNTYFGFIYTIKLSPYIRKLDSTNLPNSSIFFPHLNFFSRRALVLSDNLQFLFPSIFKCDHIFISITTIVGNYDNLFSSFNHGYYFEYEQI